MEAVLCGGRLRSGLQELQEDRAGVASGRCVEKGHPSLSLRPAPLHLTSLSLHLAPVHSLNPMAEVRPVSLSGQSDILTRTPCELWEAIEGRSVWLLGDSQTLDFYKGVVCALKEFVDVDAGPPLPPAT